MPFQQVARFVPATVSQRVMAMAWLAGILAALGSILNSPWISSAAHAVHVAHTVLADHESPIIAVMGETGVGKSSMIRALDGRNTSGHLPDVSHNLQPCGREPVSICSLWKMSCGCCKTLLEDQLLD